MFDTLLYFSVKGFDGMFLGRIDYQDKSQRLVNKTMEMIWSGCDNLGKMIYFYFIS